MGRQQRGGGRAGQRRASAGRMLAGGTEEPAQDTRTSRGEERSIEAILDGKGVSKGIEFAEWYRAPP